MLYKSILILSIAFISSLVIKYETCEDDLDHGDDHDDDDDGDSQWHGVYGWIEDRFSEK